MGKQARLGEHCGPRIDAAGCDFGGELGESNVLNCGSDQNPLTGTPQQPFLCDSPIDTKWGPDGNFYVLSYGDGFFNANADAQLVRFSYVNPAGQ